MASATQAWDVAARDATQEDCIERRRTLEYVALGVAKRWHGTARSTQEVRASDRHGLRRVAAGGAVAVGLLVALSAVAIDVSEISEVVLRAPADEAPATKRPNPEIPKDEVRPVVVPAGSLRVATVDRPRAAPTSTAIPFQMRGGAMVVSVRLTGPEVSLDVPMVFDTGATYTVIDRATAAALGLGEPDRPRLPVRTAGGEVVRWPVDAIEAASLGPARVDGGLAVLVRDGPSAVDGTVGLLGLNFARHFRVEIDLDRRVLKLHPRRRAADRVADVLPFVEIEGARVEDSRVEDSRAGRVEVSLVLHNRGRRPVSEVMIGADDAEGRPVSGVATVVPSIGPRAQVKVRFEPSRPPVGPVWLRVRSASWSRATGRSP